MPNKFKIKKNCDKLELLEKLNASCLGYKIEKVHHRNRSAAPRTKNKPNPRFVCAFIYTAKDENPHYILMIYIYQRLNAPKTQPNRNIQTIIQQIIYVHSYI